MVQIYRDTHRRRFNQKDAFSLKVHVEQFFSATSEQVIYFFNELWLIQFFIVDNLCDR